MGKSRVLLPSFASSIGWRWGGGVRGEAGGRGGYGALQWTRLLGDSAAFVVLLGTLLAWEECKLAAGEDELGSWRATRPTAARYHHNSAKKARPPRLLAFCSAHLEIHPSGCRRHIPTIYLSSPGFPGLLINNGVMGVGRAAGPHCAAYWQLLQPRV